MNSRIHDAHLSLDARVRRLTTEVVAFLTALVDGRFGGRDKMVHALEAKTGKPLWTSTTRARGDSSPAIGGGRVFVSSNDGRVYVLDLASCKKVWEYEAASPVTSSPAVAKRKVVVATADGEVICFG